MTVCNHLVSRKSGDVFISYFAHACECPHCLARRAVELEARIKELRTACEAVAHALTNNDMAGVCVWILPPYQAKGVHESAWERFQAVLNPDQAVIPQTQGTA